MTTPWFSRGLRGKTWFFQTRDLPTINPWFTHDNPWFSSRKIMGSVGPNMNTSGALFGDFSHSFVRHMRHWIKTGDGKFDSCATSIEPSINSMWVWFSHSTDCKSVANSTKNRRIYALLWWRLFYTVFADLLANRKWHVEFLELWNIDCTWKPVIFWNLGFVPKKPFFSMNPTFSSGLEGQGSTV